ncbi:hypothetical protein TNIN_10721 [Trichonephila inaurata madagascariensis]|uniref:Uncharacterized protein n=1 Tax=Trichonephila inaurata madagascariensis TaxID=2747483 RepID=A0A8X6YEP8_9ARAC|nr:hypothetical protein TNIN_10721 [Trichonephila inaurata madagascariensis]
MCLELFKQKADSLEIIHNDYLEGLEDDQDFENEFITVEEYWRKIFENKLRAKHALEHLKKVMKENKTVLPIMARSYKMINSRKHYANDSLK